ncbi:MAG: phosphoenolpyruvate--protein phosphotransferase [Anaerolineae bacterium]
MIPLKGIPAAPGVAVGPAHLYGIRPGIPPTGPAEAPEAERRRLQEATEAARDELSRLIAQSRGLLGESAASLFEAHLMMLEDPSLHEAVLGKIEGGRAAEAAVADSVNVYAARLEALESPLFRARASDVQEVGERLIRALLGSSKRRPPEFPGSWILVARDLALSDLVRVDKERVLGWCTEKGSGTSHAAILARALGFPAVVGLGQALREVNDGDQIAFDGERGTVFVHPDPGTRRRLEKQQARHLDAHERSRSQAQDPSVTLDGHRIPILANLSDSGSAAIALSHGAEGVGLLRTEFLFLDRPLIPDEEEQYSAYAAVVEAMGDRPVTVRTLDLGGDKRPPFLPRLQPGSADASRGIGLSLERPAFFKMQLRALLRAAATRDLRILLPMVTTVEEVRSANTLFQDCRDELESDGRSAGKNIQMGVMVEVPAAVEIVEDLAAEANFLSLGTNDLIPHLLDSDRAQEERRDPLDPLVLRTLGRVVEAGHSAGIPVAICGELAGDLEAIPLLVGLGLDELSMRPTAIPAVKQRIRSLNRTQAQALLLEALQLSSASELRRITGEFASV